MNKKVKTFILLLFATVIIGCADESSNDAPANTTPPVIALDTTPPVITLVGESTINLTVGETYTEAGSTVTDNIDTGLSANHSGTVDTSTAGTYTIAYTASDAAGNQASATRTVVVSDPTDTTPPVIVLVGESTINLTVGETYTEAGSTVTDNIDTGLSANTSGTVDTSTAGTYIITYTASDAAGNEASAIRTVVVSDPVIEGDAYIFHSLNDDTYFMEYWGDTWGTVTQYTDQPADTTYEKALEISESAEWGTVVAWGNEPENAVDISAYTHAKFKIKTDTFTAVEVFVQSPSAVDTQVAYNFTNGTDLQNGWVEMEVALPGFSDMSWFALNFTGGTGTATVLLADVYFTTQEVVVNCPASGPTPPLLDDNDVVALYSDALTQDGFIAVWNSNWWNAPVYSECDIAGDHFAKYQITDGGIAGGVVGLEYGFEIEPLDAAAKTSWNLDLYVEAGITKISLQLVSSDGSATYVIDNPSVDTWESYEILFSDMTDNDGGGVGVLNSGVLQAAGIQLWGPAGQSVYLDNFYFSGEADFYDLTVTVTDNSATPVAGAMVSVGNVFETTDANGIAILNIHEGEHRVVVDAEGYGVLEGNQTVLGGDASLSLSVSPSSVGPSQAAPATNVDDEDAIVLYSDSLTVDQPISFWSDNWWNAPTFSEVNIDGDNAAKLQIIPDGVEGGVTGIQYGIEDGPLDASTAVGIRFDMFATSGITRAQFQVLSVSAPGFHTIFPVTTGQWVTVTVPFTDLSAGPAWTASALTQLGVALWGTTSDAIYLDNIYFYK